MPRCRYLATAFLVAAAAVVQLATVAGARVVDDPTATDDAGRRTEAHGTGDAFRTGEASGSADTFTLNIKQGNANIGFSYGRSLANYRDRTGSAEARAMDLGVLPTLFAVPQCDGSAPVLNPATLPPLTRVDSTQVEADASRRVEAFMPGFNSDPAGPSAGFQDATALPAPAVGSTATTDSVDLDIAIMALDGGHSEVTTRLVGDVRTAHAIVTADQLRVFGGLFTFDDPRWEAVARSGGITTTEGRFTFTHATVLGVPRTVESALADLEGFATGLEQLLAPLGVEFELPSVTVDGGRVKVSPMAFRVVDPPFGRDVIAPFLGAIQPLREALVQQALADDCTNETGILLLDVILGVAAGSGSVEILAGGVDVSTADTDFTVEPLVIPPPPVAAPPTTTVAAQVQSEVAYDSDAEEFGLGDSLGFEDDLGFDDMGFEDMGFDEDLGLSGDFEAADDLGFDDAEQMSDDEGAEELATAPATATRAERVAGTTGVVVGIVALLIALALPIGERMKARRMTRRIP